MKIKDQVVNLFSAFESYLHSFHNLHHGNRNISKFKAALSSEVENSSGSFRVALPDTHLLSCSSLVRIYGISTVKTGQPLEKLEIPVV